MEVRPLWGWEGNNIEDMILFAYLWVTHINGYNTRNEYSVKSDSARFHTMVDNMCMGVDKYGNPCIKCNS